MKKSIKPLVFSIIFLASMALAHISLAQPQPSPLPPSGSKGGTENGDPGSGGGAPIEGGLAISLAMIAGFGGWKLFKLWQTKNKPSESVKD